MVVVGGGFAGVVAALSIANEGRRVLILDASAVPPRFSGDLIHPLGRQLLADLGVLPELLACGAVSIDGFAVFPGTSQQAATMLPYRESARGLVMDSRALGETLRRAAASHPAIELHCGCEAVEILRRDGRVIGVRDAAGQEWCGRLTIVAQGRHARLRRQLGFAEKPRPLSISTALTLRDVPLPVQNYAHIFLPAAADGSGPLLAHTLGGGDVRVSIDLPRKVGEGPLSERILRLDLDNLPAELAKGLRDTLHDHYAETELATRTTCAFRTRRCAAAGVALIGDAAGCTHPITGTGMTTALVDAWILRQELDRADRPRRDATKALDRALLRYQQRRYRFARPREHLAEGLYEIFCGSEDGTAALRHGLFHYWNGSHRSRRASVALLSGEDSSLRRLFAEYLRVCTAAVRVILATPRCGYDLPSLASILRRSVRTLSRFMRSAVGRPVVLSQ